MSHYWLKRTKKHTKRTKKHTKRTENVKKSQKLQLSIGDVSDDVYEESDDDNEDNVQKIKKIIHKITIVYKNRCFFY